MATVPKKVAERLVAGIKRYQPILSAAKARDVGEAATVAIVKDIPAAKLTQVGMRSAEGYRIPVQDGLFARIYRVPALALPPKLPSPPPPLGRSPTSRPS